MGYGDSGSLDPQGVYALSSSATHHIRDGAATLRVRPWEVYEFDRSASPQLRRVLEWCSEANQALLQQPLKRPHDLEPA